MKLKTPRSDLLTFGFNARDYKKDHSALIEMSLQQNLGDNLMPQINDTETNENAETLPDDDELEDMVQRLLQ